MNVKQKPAYCIELTADEAAAILRVLERPHDVSDSDEIIVQHLVDELGELL
jgi:hypothetical protein